MAWTCVRHVGRLQGLRAFDPRLEEAGAARPQLHPGGGLASIHRWCTDQLEGPSSRIAARASRQAAPLEIARAVVLDAARLQEALVVWKPIERRVEALAQSPINFDQATRALLWLAAVPMCACLVPSVVNNVLAAAAGDAASILQHHSWLVRAAACAPKGRRAAIACPSHVASPPGRHQRPP